MQPKFTLLSVRSCLRRSRALLILFCLLSGTGFSQTYTNAPLSTGATSSGGVTAPAGYTWSELQIASGGTSIGENANIDVGTSVADDFTVPAGQTWNLSKLTVYAYQTGYTGSTSPFNRIHVRIHSSNPASGPTTIVFGDLTTNRFSASTEAGIYRVATASPTAADLNRRVWIVEAAVSVSLPAGTYWIEYRTGITTAGAHFLPNATVAGTMTQSGWNAIKNDLTGYIPITDGSPLVPQALPFKLDYTATGTPCVTPTPGATQSSSATVCPGISFTLSVANPTTGLGVSYQWQSSPNGTTWTNIAGATNPTYSTSQTVATYYRANVTCATGPSTVPSSSLQVNMTPASGCYCIPPATDCSDDDIISNVTFGSSLNNTSVCSGATGYTDYTTTVAATNIIQGASNPMSVSGGVNWSKAVGVWIDYNKNGQFETSEFTSLGTSAGGTPLVSGVVAVPGTATLGQTRMRVRLRFGATLFTGAQACTNPSAYGETEDYTVNIVPCVPITFTAQPTSKTIVCGEATTFAVTTAGSIPSYVWQQRISATAPWTTVTNGGVFSGATTATLALTDAPVSMNGYQYRALVTGACSGTDFSSTATLTVNPLIATVNPTSATICAGSIQPLTITNTAAAPTTVSFNSGPISVVIPESETGNGANHTIAVSGIPAGATITRVDVRLNMTHTWAGDVNFSLKAPNNAVLNLDYFLSSTGGAGATTGFTNTIISSAGTAALNTGANPFTATFKADAQMEPVIPGNPPAGAVGFTPTVSNFSGLYSTPNGNWTLGFFDYFVDPAPGTLTSWSIIITYVSPIPATGVFTATAAEAGTIFTDAAGTIPYTGTPITTVYVKPNNTTNYSVVVTTATCTTPALSIPITVARRATGLAVANRSGCPGSNVTFTSTTTAGGPFTYQWQVSPTGNPGTYTDISGATSATYGLTGITAAQNNNRYRVYTTSSPCAGSDTSNAATLTVFPATNVTIAAPVTSIVPGQTATFTATSTPAAATYAWTLNGTAITGATTGTVTGTIDALGTYGVTVTDVNGCVGTKTVTLTGGASDRLWIYPNPSDGNFQVRLFSSGNPTDRREVSIYDLHGQRVASKTVTLDNVNGPYLRIDFNLTGMSSGTYVVKVADKVAGKVTSGLVVIQ